MMKTRFSTKVGMMRLQTEVVKMRLHMKVKDPGFPI